MFFSTTTRKLLNNMHKNIKFRKKKKKKKEKRNYWVLSQVERQIRWSIKYRKRGEMQT
jgi:hypothetical protein